MVVLDILFLQISNKPKLTSLNLTNLPSHTLTLPGDTFPSSYPNKDLHLMQDDFFKKLSKFDKVHFGTAELH